MTFLVKVFTSFASFANLPTEDSRRNLIHFKNGGSMKIPAHENEFFARFSSSVNTKVKTKKLTW